MDDKRPEFVELSISTVSIEVKYMDIFTSSKYLSREPTDCCNGWFLFYLTQKKKCTSFSYLWCMYWSCILLMSYSKSCKSCRLIWLCFVMGV